MRSLLWTHSVHPRFGSNPMLLGIAVALAELYEPLIRETLPHDWTDLLAAFEAGISER